MTPVHHVDPALLAEYAAGTLPEPIALLTATHLALCPCCRRQTQDFEAIGGALIETVSPVAPEPDTLEAIFARIDAGDLAAVPDVSPVPHVANQVLPEPLRSYVGDLASAPWKRRGSSLEEISLPMSRTGRRASLMRIKAGRRMPRHGHGGTETVLVLAGGFTDEQGHYRRGDVSTMDASMIHRPVADDDGDCLCLAVVEGSIRLHGPVGRVLGLFVR